MSAVAIGLWPGAELAAAPGVPGAGSASPFVRCRLGTDPAQVYYLFVPSAGGAGAPVLASVHGISRNARRHVASYVALAERAGVVVVAPLFPAERYRDYQRLGFAGRGARADLALLAILDEAGRRTGAHAERVYLAGFSGGAQFAHRFAFAHPERVRAMAICAAGWYTFPDTELPFPYGLRAAGTPDGIAFDAAAALRIPTFVFVGEHDTERDASLRTSVRVDRQQGANRLERARRWVAALRVAARHHGVPACHRLTLLPYTAHSYRDAIDRGALVQRVFEAFFASALPIDRHVDTA